MLLYPEIEPFDSGELVVSGLHSIYYECCGNPHGKPVVFLHGGPGCGSDIKDRQLFDPKEYLIVLFDQRGCGRSTPWGELRENETANLISDMEKLREHLGLRKWMVVGSSWGTTLALVYAQAHPQRVSEMILKGVFLGREKDIEWVNSRWGAGALFPEEFQKYIDTVPAGQHENLPQAYYDMLRSRDQSTRRLAALEFVGWEGRICPMDWDFEPFPAPNEAALRFLGNMANILNFYTVNKFFLAEDQIINSVHRLRSIPAVIIHGRYDMVCPVSGAWELYKEWPGAELIVVADAGHSGGEIDLKDEFIKAIDRFAKLK